MPTPHNLEIFLRSNKNCAFRAKQIFRFCKQTPAQWAGKSHVQQGKHTHFSKAQEFLFHMHNLVHSLL